MAKKESTLINMLVTLLLITTISSASLGFMYQLTKEPASAARMAKKDFAIKAVLPEYDNSPSSEVIKEPVDGDTVKLYLAKKNGQLVGVAVETFTTTGFSGLVRLMVGFDRLGNIINISVLEQKETPGLGSKMVEPDFKNQYNGKNPGSNNLAVRKDGGEVDAITAATISSRAFSDAVARAYSCLEKTGLLK